MDSIKLEADKGDANVQYKMFRFCFKDHKADALAYLKSSAHQKHPRALYQLSEIYTGGYYSDCKELEIAKSYCEEAAALGDEEAIFTIEVSTLTEGWFGYEKNYKEGVKNAKELAEKGNVFAKEFLESIMESSHEALAEASDLKTDDFAFLKDFLGWEEE